MAIAAKIAPTELTAQVTNRFDGAYFEARLVNHTDYTPSDVANSDSTWLTAATATEPTGSGYRRQVISYAASDVSTYSDDGIGLAQRATVFAHDGVGAAIDFNQVALVWSSGNAVTLGAVTTSPTGGTAASDGVYENIPVDSGGSGSALTVDVTVSGSGTVFAVAIKNAGLGYTAADSVTVNASTLNDAKPAGAPDLAGTLVFPVATVSSSTNSGDLIAVAKTAGAVSLAGGNEAAFYWNLKLFGYYTP